MIPLQIPSQFFSFAQIENHLNTLETAHLKASYEFGQFIEKQRDATSLRIHAVAIPFICLIGETIKIILDAKRILEISFRSIYSLSLKTGNVRIGATHACEHLRNLAGITTGLFVALYSPLQAKKLFLTPKAENLRKKLSPDAAATLYAIAYAVSSFFKKHNIDYRICHGTLLGAFRHKGIIPWDDDMDIMIHPNCTQKCRELFESGVFTQETGMGVKEQFWTGGWQCFDPSTPKGEGPLKEIGTPFLDVFRTKLDSSKQNIIHDSKIMKTFFSEERIGIKEWENFKEYSFGPLCLTSIEDAKSYLSRRYGSEVLDFAFQVLHHDFLASLADQPLNLLGHFHKIWQYELPRRTYLEERSPVEYNEKKYEEMVRKIDNGFQTKKA